MMCNVIGREGSNWDSLYEDNGRRSSGRFGRRNTDSEKRFEPRALPFEESSASTKISDAPLCSFSSPAAILKASGPPTISPAHPEELRAVCNCKKSKCLKLYCQCFAAMMHCGENCNCNDCSNRIESESVSSAFLHIHFDDYLMRLHQVRQEAITATKERNPTAFLTKVQDSFDAI